ncbi:MAG: c-type cytochrome [Opitutales bacterium]|jgi:mono/diheme cytochrome c family protein
MSEDQKDMYPHEGESRDTFEGTRFDDQDLQRVHSQLMREKEEPTENFSPMPLFFVALFMVLAFWAGIYLVHYSGDFGPFHYDETVRGGVVEDTGPREVDMMALGKRVYNQNCVACHQATGLGLPGVYPPLVGSDWVKDNPERLIKVVLAGLAGKVIVNGEEYNNAMTPFARLKDQHIAAVLTYIRTSPDYQNNSHAVSEELVKQVRDAYGARTDPWSQTELETIHGPVTGVWQPAESAEAPAPEASPEEAVPAA